MKPVSADISQIQQVLMNLAVNAADAMPDGGKIIIETSMAELDENYASNHPGGKPGSFVMLSVSDTGCGMDDTTKSQVFEPFFTTKGEQGTGLGLATVYGIVKQHNGYIWIYSEQGKGTTFKVYLPVTDQVESAGRTQYDSSKKLTGSEKILLVEDNDEVRQTLIEALTSKGYTVIAADKGSDAFAKMSAVGEDVQLLLTDVVMPGMNGKELFESLSRDYPSLKVLYMSGYTENIIVHHGVLQNGVQFIQKPFSCRSLAAKVREVIDS